MHPIPTQRRPRRAGLEGITRLAGVVALLSVLGTTVTVLVDHRPGAGSRGPTRGRVHETDWQQVRSASGRIGFRVPSGRRWSVSRPGVRAGLRGVGAGADPVVSATAYFDRGWCDRQPRWSSRALVGVAPRVRSTDPRSVNAWVVEGWLRAIAVHGRPRVLRERSAGSTGRWSSSTVVTTSSGGPCTPPRIRLDAVSLRTGTGGRARVATVVLVADRGRSGDLGGEVIERILRTVRALDPASLR